MWERHEMAAFLVLAEELHFGRTAERLGLTTGRISRTIKAVERRVGAPLFERTSRTVRLTPLGEQLAADLRPIVRGLDAALERAVAAARGVTGVLHVAFLGATTAPVLLRGVELFQRRHPDCEVRVHEERLATTRAHLSDGTVDVLLAAFPFDGMATGPALIRERQVLAVAAGHRLAREPAVSLEVLADHPVIQYPQATSRSFKEHRTPSRTPGGRPVPRGPQGESFSEMLSLVALGRGVLPVGEHTPGSFPHPGIAYVPITDAPPILRGPVWAESRTTARVRAFVRAAVDAAPHSSVPPAPGR
ncbi:LysR family transcriptional regulator [Streptomyces sp. CA2R106]|uniref:LysR family transcriptional regulator n=1 Tax=Streptomyces sp. CA2R106 TaxID=3120153 RepID=UPI00300AE673